MENLSIDQGGFYPIVIHEKLLRAISPKIGNFARAIKRSRDHVCASTDAIASDRSRKTKGPGHVIKSIESVLCLAVSTSVGK